MSENDTTTKPQGSSDRAPEVDQNAEETVYSSPLRPLLWLVLPFVLTLLYGIFAPG